MSKSLEFVKSDGSRYWYMPDEKLGAPTDENIERFKLHRTDGPALITSEKSVWYENGKMHRFNGPAIERVGEEVDEKKDYFIGGNHINLWQYKRFCEDSGIDPDNLDEYDSDSIYIVFGQPNSRQ